MIQLIAPEFHNVFSENIEAMQRLRYRVFNGRLGWDVSTHHGREVDVFDGLKPHYLLLRGEHGSVDGCVRLLPSTGPNMLRNVFSELLDGKEAPSQLDIRALQAFLAAMSTGSITGAAQLLGKSQPAVTRVVRELEEAVGFQLFHRNGPRISPTERGLLFHEEAVRLMAGMRQISSRATAIRDNIAASLDIVATPTMSGGLIAPALARLGEAQPDFINVQTMGAEHVVRSVHARTADIGVSSFPLDYAGLAIQAICERDCVGVVAQDDPLARHSVLPLASLAERRLVTVGNAFRLRRAIDRAISQAGIRPSSDFSTNTSLNAVMAARAGLGVAIIDPVTAFGIPVQGVKVLPLDVKIPYFWGLFSDAARVVSPLTRAFVDAFVQSCAAVIPDCRFHNPDDQPDMSPDRDH